MQGKIRRREIEVMDYSTPYRVNVPAIGRCEVVLGEKMEMKEFKYLGTVLCKHGEMEGEIRVVKGRCVLGSLAREWKECIYGGKGRFKNWYSFCLHYPDKLWKYLNGY